MSIIDVVKGWFTDDGAECSKNEHKAAPTKIGFEGKEVHIRPTTELRRKRNEGRIRNLEIAIRQRIRAGLENETKTQNLKMELERRKHLKSYYDLGGE